MKLKLVSLMTMAAFSAAAMAQVNSAHDEFYWISQINKASIVINSDEGLLDKKDAVKIANGLRKVIEAGNNGGPRPKKALTFEPHLIKASGPEASLIHAGRSSQDMHATHRSLIMMEDVIAMSDALHKMTESLWKLASEHKATLVPNYTNGVPAQPNTYGHQLLGHIAGFLRDADRIQDFMVRLDRSSMGTTVLNGTSWPLNRERMAKYLGFSNIVENAYDASQISSMENPVELAGVVTALNLHIGHFVEDTLTQYAQTRPWILLQEGGGNTYASTAMPQKRNPGLLNDTRQAASTAIGYAEGSILRAHNITPGMSDPKDIADNTLVVKETINAINKLNRVINALVINPERALEELNNDWTSSQEVADRLMREYKLPFRVGHHVASQMVTYAKNHNLRPLDFPYEQMKVIYAEVVKKEYPKGSTVLPMSEEEFKATIDPRTIVNNRKTLGGPQPAEMEKMLKSAQTKLAANAKWSQAQKDRLAKAAQLLEADFNKIK